MSDLEIAGNLVALGLCLPSLALWCFVVARAYVGRSPLDLQPRAPCPWNGWAIGLAFPVSVIVQAVVFTSTPEIAPISLEAVQRACLMNVAEAAVLMGLLALGTPIRAADFGIDRETTHWDVVIGLAGVLAAWLPVYAINLLVHHAGLRKEDEVHSFFKILDASPGTATIGWIVLGAVILAPLTEELLYRVVIQGWLESRLPPHAAIVFVAIIFAAIHGQPDALPLFPLALILGYVYYRRHSLLATFTLHAAFNGANLALALMTTPTPM